MPGIVGLITRKPRDGAAAELARMVATMQHEPFYVSGTWCDEELGLYVGWVEREDAAIGDMPLGNEIRDKALIFSGEEFSPSGLRTHLSIAANSAIDESNLLASLNGQFHGLLCDLGQQSVTLFNDRYGLRRVYYHEAADAFYFAAEAKAILAVRSELRELDPPGMGEFFSCGCVLENRTLFKHIHLLPCAARWVFRNGALASRGTYFCRSEWERRDAATPGEYYDELRNDFQQSVARSFGGSTPIGLSLTGGLDTRMILAWRRPQPQALPCYTFGGSHRECRDVRIARAVATRYGQKHRVIEVGQEFLSDFPRYAERAVYLTDGAAGVQHAPDLYVNRLARSIAPIRMTGNYGDQVLRHLTVFRPRPPAEGLFASEFVPWIAQAAATYDRVNVGHALTRATTNQTAWHYYGILALESSQLTMRTPYLDNDLVRTLYRAPAGTLANNDLRVRLIRDGDPALARIRTDLGFAGRGGKAASMLSQQWHRFTMRAEYACEHGSPRWIAHLDHEVLGGCLERTFVGRHKFAHFALWYRNELAQYLQDMLLDARSLSRSYLNPAAIRSMVHNHLAGHQNETPAIHKLLTLEYVHRMFIDTP